MEDASYCAGFFKRSDLNMEHDDAGFKHQLTKVFENHVNTMDQDSMDLNDMKHVVHLMNTQQWDAIFPYVENVNETYFRELVMTLIQSAKQKHRIERWSHLGTSHFGWVKAKIFCKFCKRYQYPEDDDDEPMFNRYKYRCLRWHR